MSACFAMVSARDRASAPRAVIICVPFINAKPWTGAVQTVTGLDTLCIVTVQRNITLTLFMLIHVYTSFAFKLIGERL